MSDKMKKGVFALLISAGVSGAVAAIQALIGGVGSLGLPEGVAMVVASALTAVLGYLTHKPEAPQ